jgi:folate-binding protein YgfZ
MSTEVLQSQTPNLLQLDDVHNNLGATMAERDGWLQPASYSGWEEEYSAVRNGRLGISDLSARGRVEVSGSEAVAFLNGMITNDVKTLEDGAWMLAAFPNVQGRLLALVRVLRIGDSYLFDTEAATTNKVVQTLSRFTMAGDFKVTDKTRDTACLSVQGGAAAQLIRGALGEQSGILEFNRTVKVPFQDEEVILFRATHTGEDGFDLIASIEAARQLWKSLVGNGAVPVGFDALDVMRIEAGLPRYGVDMDDSTVVLETGLDDAVSFTKGCYIGQEIIARIHFRGHVAKRISGVLIDGGRAKPGDRLLAIEGKEAGRLTSVTYSPLLDREIALGFVRYDYLTPGTRLQAIVDETELSATVADLPFIKGSWQGNAQEGETAG